MVNEFATKSCEIGEENLELTADETRLVEYCRRGIKADFSCPSPDSEVRVVRAEVLRRLILGLSLNETTGAIVHLGVQMKGVQVLGGLFLANSTGSHAEDACPPLLLEDCHFVAKDSTAEHADDLVVDLQHARVARLALVDCTLSCVNLEGAWIGGLVDLSGLHAPADHTTCRVRARGARIAGSIHLDRAKLALPDRERNWQDRPDYACDLGGARVEGGVYGRSGLKVIGGMALPKFVGGDVWLDGASLVREGYEDRFALFAQSCVFQGVVAMRPQWLGEEFQRFETKGPINLYGTCIAGTLDLNGAHLLADDYAMPDGALNAHLLDVGGSCLLGSMRSPQEGKEDVDFVCEGEINLDSVKIGADLTCTPRLKKGEWLRLAAAKIGGRMWTSLNSGLLMNGASIGRDFELKSQEGATVSNIHAEHVSIGGKFSCEGSILELDISGAIVGHDLELKIKAENPPKVRAYDISVAGNCFCEGNYGWLDFWGGHIGGQFGSQSGKEYRANVLVGTEMHVSGIAWLNCTQELRMVCAVMTNQVTIQSLAPPPGLKVEAKHLRCDQDVIVRGTFSNLAVADGRVGANFDMSEANVGTADLDRAQVDGDLKLPKNIFGKFSFDGGRVGGKLFLGPTKLHARRYSNETGVVGKVSLTDTEIRGDLRVHDVKRDPEDGMDVTRSLPDWFDKEISGQNSSDVRVFTRQLRCYPPSTQVVEVQRLVNSSVREEWEAHAFLVPGNGDPAVYLDGRSPVIHRFNAGADGKSPLSLDTKEAALDYLYFFCGYVWGENGPFLVLSDRGEIVLDNEGSSATNQQPWFRADNSIDSSEGAARNGVVVDIPPKAEERDGKWHFDATIVYADTVFRAHMIVPRNGVIEMTSDVPVFELQPISVDFKPPVRRFVVENNRGPFWVMTPGKDWSELADEQRVEAMRRIHNTFNIDSPLEKEDAVVDLSGCHCGTLDHDHGEEWGKNLRVDLRGFEYQEIGADRQNGLTDQFDLAESRGRKHTHGEELGRTLYQWVERVSGTNADHFSVQPYEQVVRVLSRRGDQDAARTVLEHKLKQENDRRNRLPKWTIRLGLEFPFRYGLFSGRGLLVVGIYWLVGIWVFDIANYGHFRLLPIGSGSSNLAVLDFPLGVNPALMIDSQPVTIMVTPSDKPVFSRVAPSAADQAEEARCGDQVESAIYALDAMLPLIDLHQEEKCTITSADGWVPLLWRVFKMVYTLIGAYVTSMLILTVSGVLRRGIER